MRPDRTDCVNMASWLDPLTLHYWLRGRGGSDENVSHFYRTFRKRNRLYIDLEQPGHFTTKQVSFLWATTIHIGGRNWTHRTQPHKLCHGLLTSTKETNDCRILSRQIMGCQRTCSASTHRIEPFCLDEGQQLSILNTKEQDNESHTIPKSGIGFAAKHTKRGGNRGKDIERTIGKPEPC